MTDSWRVLRRPAAKADLIDIWNRIAQDDPAAADRVVDRIGQAIDRLATFPRLGGTRPFLERAHAYSVAGYLVVYLVDEASRTVDIARILDARRDVPSIVAGL